jgi:hypothetical protein
MNQLNLELNDERRDARRYRTPAEMAALFNSMKLAVDRA